jgi:hypothetical protein
MERYLCIHGHSDAFRQFGDMINFNAAAVLAGGDRGKS